MTNSNPSEAFKSSDRNDVSGKSDTYFNRDGDGGNHGHVVTSNDGQTTHYARDEDGNVYVDDSRDSDGGSRVICTHFLETGKLSRELWALDIRHTQMHISPLTVCGYHFWAIPYVRLMRRSKLAEQLMFPLTKWRAEELAYQAGVRSEPCVLGKIVRLFGEPACWLLGCFVSQRDWRTLQTANSLSPRSSGTAQKRAAP